ncbi:hypothetical protein RLW55_19740 [Hyphomicrobium sp. B1]|uniref:hypothetical protein n=1 Tax=unclassified Hyphomicrobium TaxID=2619925 RepID=UPI00391D7BF9
MADVIEIEATTPAESFLSWRGILAGAAAGSAFSLVLISLGLAGGLSLLSPWPGQSHTGLAASVAAAWSLIATIASFLIAGFVAARVRPRVADVPADEVEFRDGVQGFVAWAVCVLFAGLIAVGASGLALHATSAVAKFSDRTSSSPLSAIVSTLSAPPEGKPVTAAVPLFTADETRTIEGVFLKSVGSSGMAPKDKSFVANIVAAKAGIPLSDAETRVDVAYADAVAALDKAKKATELSGLLTGIGLLIGLAAAWYGGVRGGKSRDENMPGRLRFGGW